ncbi:hypothetical protein RJ640_022813 [Escallonia rubra]|uniref:Uncharacterized protein n=1 Tax=Escallonia rubra TaxID=112253 RepID=A0AA88RZ38_9ASTE|nr:hypothetical protein RJ640_022813 [Escallonia rubra]
MEVSVSLPLQSTTPSAPAPPPAAAMGDRSYMILIGLNYMRLFLGSVSSSLFSKFYFNHTGSCRQDDVDDKQDLYDGADGHGRVVVISGVIFRD